MDNENFWIAHELALTVCINIRWTERNAARTFPQTRRPSYKLGTSSRTCTRIYELLLADHLCDPRQLLSHNRLHTSWLSPGSYRSRDGTRHLHLRSDDISTQYRFPGNHEMSQLTAAIRTYAATCIAKWIRNGRMYRDAGCY